MAATSNFEATKARVFAVLTSALQSSAGEAEVAAVRGALGELQPPPAADAEGEEAVAARAEAAKALDVQRSTLELIMRMFMEDLLQKSRQPGQSIEEVGVPKLLDLSIALAAADAADYNTPFALLEDLFDAQVISAAERAFALVEARAASLAPFLAGENK
eukprot:gene6874-8396_t